MFTTSHALPINMDKLTEKQVVVYDKFAELEKLHKTGKATATELTAAESKVKDELKALNAAIVLQWCDELKDLSKNEAMETYIANAGELCAFKLSAPSKNGEKNDYSVTATMSYVPFSIMDKHLNLASSTTYGIKLGQFAHNVARYITDSKCGIGTNAPKFYGTKATKKESPLFMGYSKKDLQKQMDSIAKDLRPADMAEVHFHSHDINYVLFAATRATSGKGATVQTVDEKAFLRYIVTAMHFRTAGKEYNFQSKAKVHQTPKAK
jgi:hypothetical protein